MHEIHIIYVSFVHYASNSLNFKRKKYAHVDIHDLIILARFYVNIEKLFHLVEFLWNCIRALSTL